MKTCQTSKCAFMRTLLMAISITHTSMAFAQAYNDVTAWWHFDYDANQNGRSDVSEIRDQRDWGTSALKGSSGYHATSVNGSLGSPSWTNEVVSPAGGSLYGKMSMFFKPVTNATQCFPDSFRVDNLVLTGSSTIITRFRWDGYAFNSNNQGWLYNNGYGLWADKIGWLFGVQSSGGFNRLSLLVGQTYIDLTSVAITPDKWYEAAAVLTDNGPGNTDTVELFLWPENNELYYQKIVTSSVTNASATATGTIIGAQVHATNYGVGNSLKAFKGAVNHIAVWDRALSYSEVLEAFCNPQPIIQIGINNGSASDYRGLSEFNTAPYNQGEPWSLMPQGVTDVHRDATLKVPLALHQQSLNYVLNVGALIDSDQTAGLTLIVNATTNVTQRARNGKNLDWFIPSSQLVAGTNSFTLRYDSGPASHIHFDRLEIGGSWQIGHEDNSHAEFESQFNAPDRFYVTNPNWKQVERAIGLASSETNTHLHFFLSEELTRKYLFSYTVRIIAQSSQSTIPFSIDLNGKLMRSYAPVTNGTYVTTLVEPDQMISGENVISLRYDSSESGYMQFDFHRLMVYEKAKGTLIKVR